jgi:hypothetical protein
VPSTACGGVDPNGGDGWERTCSSCNSGGQDSPPARSRCVPCLATKGGGRRQATATAPQRPFSGRRTCSGRAAVPGPIVGSRGRAAAAAPRLLPAARSRLPAVGPSTTVQPELVQRSQDGLTSAVAAAGGLSPLLLLSTAHICRKLLPAAHVDHAAAHPRHPPACRCCCRMQPYSRPTAPAAPGIRKKGELRKQTASANQPRSPPTHTAGQNRCQVRRHRDVQNMAASSVGYWGRAAAKVAVRRTQRARCRLAPASTVHHSHACRCCAGRWRRLEGLAVAAAPAAHQRQSIAGGGALPR